MEKPAAWRRERTGQGGDTTLSGLLVLLMREPRVGPPGGQETAVQPWAEGCNPFGIDQNVQTPISWAECCNPFGTVSGIAAVVSAKGRGQWNRFAAQSSENAEVSVNGTDAGGGVEFRQPDDAGIREIHRHVRVADVYKRQPFVPAPLE